MTLPLTLTARVQPGHKLEIVAPELVEGEEVSVHVTRKGQDTPTFPFVANDHFYFTASAEQFRAALDEIAQMNRNVPPLPDSAFDRETLYEDRL